MKIELLLNARLNHHGDLAFFPFSETDRVDPVFIAHSHGSRVMPQIILHDVFHHAALGLDYTSEGEYWTVLLDRIYPWNDAPLGKLDEDLAYFADGFDELPTEEEHQEFIEHAQSKLGDLVITAFYRPIKEAFLQLVSGKNDQLDQLAGWDYKLVVRTDAKFTDEEGCVELVREGRTDTALLVA